MCGRYGLTIDQEALSIAYAVDAVLVDHRPRYNIALSQIVPVMLGDGHFSSIDGFRWGLVPPDAPRSATGPSTLAPNPGPRGPRSGAPGGNVGAALYWQTDFTSGRSLLLGTVHGSPIGSEWRMRAPLASRGCGSIGLKAGRACLPVPS